MVQDILAAYPYIENSGGKVAPLKILADVLILKHCIPLVQLTSDVDAIRLPLNTCCGYMRRANH